MKTSSLVCNGVSSPNFSGKYLLNANQAMPSQEACLQRDFMIGVCTTKAKNGDKITKQLKDFYNGAYNKNVNAPCNIVLDLPESESKDFEKCMQKIGQNFSRLA